MQWFSGPEQDCSAHRLQIEFLSYSTSSEGTNEVSSFSVVVSIDLGLDDWNPRRTGYVTTIYNYFEEHFVHRAAIFFLINLSYKNINQKIQADVSAFWIYYYQHQLQFPRLFLLC